MAAVDFREELKRIIMDANRINAISDKSPVMLEFTFVCADKSKFVRTSMLSQYGNVPMRGDIIELSDKTQDALTSLPRLFKIVKRVIPMSHSDRDAVVRSNVICLVCKEIVERKKKKRRKKTESSNLIERIANSLRNRNIEVKKIKE